MKHFADTKRQEVNYNVGAWVYVKLQPFKQHSLALRRHTKIAMRYFDPFEVIQRVSLVAYKLKLPIEARIHPVFHVSLLKPCHGDHSKTHIPIPLVTTEKGPILQPTQLLQYREIKRSNHWVQQVLVKWEGLTDDDNSWEDLQPLQQHYPHLDLGDKVDFKGGNVMFPYIVAGKLGSDQSREPEKEDGSLYDRMVKGPRVESEVKRENQLQGSNKGSGVGQGTWGGDQVSKEV